MNLSTYKPSQSQAIIDLFEQVFSASEGVEEGALIRQLVSDLLATKAQDLKGFVASSGPQVIGCIFFSRLTFADATHAFILSPVAVDTAHQGKGIGQQLIRFGLQHLKEQEVELVITYGDPGFYAQVGFQPISEDCIKAPFTLSHPEGWIAQSLNGKPVQPIAGAPQCVQALNKQAYW